MYEPMPENVVSDPRFDPTHVYIAPPDTIDEHELEFLEPPREDEALLNIETYVDDYEDAELIFYPGHYRLSPDNKIHPVVTEGPVDTSNLDEL